MKTNPSRRTRIWTCFAWPVMSIALVTSSLVVLEARAGSGSDSLGSSLRPQAVAVEGKYMFNDATITFLDGQKMRGLFAGVSSDSIGLWQVGRISWFGADEVIGLRVKSSTSAGIPTLEGAIIGGYFGLLVGYAVSEDPGFQPLGFRTLGYPEPEAGEPIFVAGVGALVGCMGAYLVASGSESEAVLDLSGDAESKWRELARLSGGARTSELTDFHIRISAGWVQFKAQSPTNQHVGEFGLWGGQRGRFTVFRRGLFTYSILPWLEAGVCVANFSEPSLENFGMWGSQWIRCEQSSSNWLYGVVGELRPLKSVLPSGISLDIGAGFGLASIDYRSSVAIAGYSYMSQADSVLSSETIKSSAFGVTLSAGVSLYPDDGLSIGFVADYTVAPAVTVNGEPALGLGSRKLGNLCLAIELGFHF